MGIFTDLRSSLTSLEAALGDPSASEVPALVRAAGAAGALMLLTETAAISAGLTVVSSSAAAVIAEHSVPQLGHGGFAQGKGHRSPTSLIQEVTGSTKADAIKRIRVGESLIEAGGGDQPEAGACRAPWHAPLSEALVQGRLSADQHDAIRRGLGEPPFAVDAADDVREWTVDAWSTAAAQLIEEAQVRTVEELLTTARSLRDVLDPEGAERRFDERFERRSFRLWTDRDGAHRASVQFDDEAAAWVRSIIDAALRPRRGGPRFVDPAEAAHAKTLEDDPRTNDQLTYDLMLDVWRAGTLADAPAVFGARQPGIRVVMTAAALSTVTGDPHLGEAPAAAVGHCEDGGQTLPGWLIAQHGCTTGQTTVVTDRTGNPLYLGRETRLFTSRQKIALAVRDGGCRWRGCDRPASYCEAHHIDHYVDQDGRTDIDRGILLCRWHHMHLHHGGWQVTRHGHDDFMLHPPDGGAPIPLPPRLALSYAWHHLRPPARRFRLAA